MKYSCENPVSLRLRGYQKKAIIASTTNNKMGIRPALKNIFDRIVYRYAFLNRVLRNINKKLSGLTTFRLRPYGTLDIRFNSGMQFRMLTNETSSVTKLLFWNGPDNYEYTGIFEKLVMRCGSFIDIGANTGYYTLLAATKNPSITAFAFEPAAAPYYYLTQNIRINRLRNAEALALALSDSVGEIEFFEVENPKNYHSRYNLAGTGTLIGANLTAEGYVRRKVPTTTLDDWVKAKTFGRVDLIKIDTEGTEHLILRGAMDVLREHAPIIICETLFNVIEKELEDIMEEFNYHFYNYQNGHLHKTSTLVRATDNGVRDCFFVPARKLDWIKPYVVENP
jgi:FkbM family methyltransferase